MRTARWSSSTARWCMRRAADELRDDTATLERCVGMAVH